MRPIKNRAGLPSLVLLLLLLSCEGEYTPKPRAYFRIDLPPRAYSLFDTTFPYAFEYPAYAVISPRNDAPGKHWLDIEFPRFKGTLHLSYMDIKGNLNKLSEDSRELVNKHMQKSSGISESLVENKQQQVYGLVYEILGSNTASPYQFYLTDSNSHFIRGALYFSVIPNNDSLAPVIEYLKTDIDHLISTLRWK